MKAGTSEAPSGGLLDTTTGASAGRTRNPSFKTAAERSGFLTVRLVVPGADSNPIETHAKTCVHEPEGVALSATARSEKVTAASWSKFEPLTRTIASCPCTPLAGWTDV